MIGDRACYCIVINLPSRPDRRRDTAAELYGVGWPENRIIWYPGIDPRSPAGFVNAGYRGCFLSHLGALNLAGNKGLDEVLILEDDCGFGPAFPAVFRAAMMDDRWDICYFGHEEPPCERGLLVEWEPDRKVILAHCYAVRGRVLSILCPYLETMLLRSPGHPAGGPMSPDGALSWFRAHHPDVVTFLAMPSSAVQRSSASDLSPRWFDRVPGLRVAAALARRTRPFGWHATYAHAVQWKLRQFGICLSTEQIAAMSEREISNVIRQHRDET